MLLAAQPRTLELQAKLLRDFADPARLAILESLRTGPLTVSELVQVTRLMQSTVSNHLDCLRAYGLVTAHPQERFVAYQLSDARVAQLLGLVDELLADVIGPVCKDFAEAKVLSPMPNLCAETPEARHTD